jgi:hypothetical protein
MIVLVAPGPGHPTYAVRDRRPDGMRSSARFGAAVSALAWVPRPLRPTFPEEFL